MATRSYLTLRSSGHKDPVERHPGALRKGIMWRKAPVAARWYAWQSSFDDEEKKSRQEALQFTKIHGMSEKEAEEHIKMVELRLSERRKAFENEFQDFFRIVLSTKRNKL